MQTVNALVAAVLASTAPSRATAKEAERMVKRAIEHFRKHGRERSLPSFSDPLGAFSHRDLFLTACALDGRCLAHGNRRDRIGRDLLWDRALDGKLYVQERLQRAREQGCGWQEVWTLDPLSRKPARLVTYFEQVDDVVIACGAYQS